MSRPLSKEVGAVPPAGSWGSQDAAGLEDQGAGWVGDDGLAESGGDEGKVGRTAGARP